MNADHYFEIGLSHKRAGTPCQDYAYSGKLNIAGKFFHFAVISDGCSGAEAETDVGSRAVVYSFVEAAFRTLIDFDGYKPSVAPQFIAQMKDELLRELKRRSEFSRLSRDYTATLVAVLLDEETSQGIEVIFGDGTIIHHHANGELYVTSAEWPDNTPIYPSNHIFDYGAMTSHIRHLIASGQTVKYSADIGIRKPMVMSKSPSDVDRGFWRPIDASHVTSISVCSDGIEQFAVEISAREIAEELTNFKNLAGSFLKRRCLKGLKTLADNGHVPIDDFSMATIYVGGTKDDTSVEAEV